MVTVFKVMPRSHVNVTAVHIRLKWYGAGMAVRGLNLNAKVRN
jgi:hypothetical protein